MDGSLARLAAPVYPNEDVGRRLGEFTRAIVPVLDYSRASIAEPLSHCYVALDQEYIAESDMAVLKHHAELVWKKVNNLISWLNKHSQPHPAHPPSSTNPTN